MIVIAMNPTALTIRLTQLKRESLRDGTVDCYDCSALVVGEPAYLTAPPRDTDVGARYIRTAPVASVKTLNETTTEFVTESGSVYQITKL